LAAWWEGEDFAEAIPLAPSAMREVAATMDASRAMVCSLFGNVTMEAVSARRHGLSLTAVTLEM